MKRKNRARHAEMERLQASGLSYMEAFKTLYPYLLDVTGLRLVRALRRYRRHRLAPRG